jgi:hypothetical protein
MFARMLSARLPELRDAAFVDPQDILCKDEACRNVDNGTPLYSDENHLTVAGARLIVPSIIENLARHPVRPELDQRRAEFGERGGNAGLSSGFTGRQ